jgi:arabinose-5-phosphate isomerase
MILDNGRAVLEIETRALERLRAGLDEAFEAVVRCIVETAGRVILTGIGKSGIICRKIAATFASTGTPAFFLHPAEAIHGDLGMIVEGDTVIAVSNSGETDELVRLLENIKRQGAHLIAITGVQGSTLAKHADLALIFSVSEEGCPMGLAPMASTTVTLALGDALAAAVMIEKKFTSENFARFHPGGKLGKKLLLVGEAMQAHGKPLVVPGASLSEALIEMSEKRLGMTAVALADGRIGFLSDGDIRRLLQQHGKAALDLRVGEVCNTEPKTISEEKLAVEALHLMEQHHITSLIVLNREGVYVGVVHLHDLWQTHMM